MDEKCPGSKEKMRSQEPGREYSIWNGEIVLRGSEPLGRRAVKRNIRDEPAGLYLEPLAMGMVASQLRKAPFASGVLDPQQPTVEMKLVLPVLAIGAELTQVQRPHIP